MTKRVASLAALLPLLALAQDPAQPEGQHAPPPQYAPPPPQYAPPPPQHAPPPPQYAPPAQPAPYPPAQVQPQGRRDRQRDSWYIGFGLGTGDGTVHFADGNVDFADMVFPGRTPFAFNFRAGATLTPKLLLGFDGGFVGASADEGSLSSSIQANK
jgi:hypothetical protein